MYSNRETQLTNKTKEGYLFYEYRVSKNTTVKKKRIGRKHQINIKNRCRKKAQKAYLDVPISQAFTF